MHTKILIKKRNRDYGILTWELSDDFDIKTLFKNQGSIYLDFDGKVKLKKVDYKYRRLSIGKTVLANNPEAEFFVLSRQKNNIHLSLD